MLTRDGKELAPERTMEPDTHDQTIRSLIRGILADLRTLIRDELALARVEMKEHAGRARAAAVSLGVAVAALVFGVVFLLVAAATALSDVLTWPVWAGFLVVAGVLALVGLVMLSSGRRRLHTVRAVPDETVSTIKENSEWIAKRLSSDRR